jgi:hypothetical protein
MYKLKKLGNFSPNLLFVADFLCRIANFLEFFRFEGDFCAFWGQIFPISVAKCGPEVHSLAKLLKSLFGTRKI